MIMEGLLSGKSMMPGFRFHPTDEELFMFYLKRKVLGKSFKPEMMAEVDVNQFAPWDLPAMSLLKTKDLNWYFFCPRAKKYPNGGKANRATGCGYWKSTGNDRSVKYKSKIVGRIKTLIFHTGKAPKGERTNWVMHEYKLEDSVVAEHGVSGDSYVICKVYEKSGLGPKNGENYGARFVEEEWESDDDCENVQGGASGLSLQDLGYDGGRVIPDGSGSALTSVTSNVASLVTAPIVSTAATANVASPNIAYATVGTPYTTATTVSTASGVPNFTSASLCTPNVTSAFCTPNFTTASLGIPYDMAACMGTPYDTPTSMGTSYDTAAFIGMKNAPVASGDTASVFADVAGAALNHAAAVLQDEEIDGMLASGDDIEEIEELLANFTEDHSEDLGDIFEGLGDLPNPEDLGNIFEGLENLQYSSAHNGIGWNDLCLEMKDLE